MCGIFGLWHTDGTAIDPAELIRATNSLRHRGPDDEGYFLTDTAAKQLGCFRGNDTQPQISLPHIDQATGNWNLAMGFRRLSILDLSPAGHQPMSTADGRYTLILNGEIYNYVELRDELIRAGRTFRSTSDSEVLLTAYEQWGHDCLTRLVGMFAFAVFDRDARSLFLARDFFGIKPLYFAQASGRLAFASEIGALLVLPWVSRRAHAQRVFDYLRFGLTDDGDSTLLSDIRQIPAAHFMEVSADGACRLERYWRIDLDRREGIGFPEAARRLRDLFVESVQLHLRSDVPLGACLSGGIDSSAIVCVMRSVAPQAALHAFSYCADDPELAEERWVDLVGRATGADVHKIRLNESHLMDDLHTLMLAQDEPFGSTSIYAQYRVFRAAANAGIKVMLDGQGADELFAGYRPYLAARLATLLRGYRVAEALRLARQASRLPGESLRSLASQVTGLLLPLGLQDMIRPLLRRDVMPPWLNREWFLDRGIRRTPIWKSDAPDVLREKLFEMFARTSLPMLLRYEDRNSMAHSIESRVPFLTPAIAEFVFSLPEEYLIDDRATSKSVFRASMRGLVPDPILDRRDKIGFATPERRWLTRVAPWIDSVLAGEDAPCATVLNLSAMRREWTAVLRGRARFDFRIWRWINFIEWCRRFDVNFEGD